QKRKAASTRRPFLKTHLESECQESTPEVDSKKRDSNPQNQRQTGIRRLAAQSYDSFAHGPSKDPSGLHKPGYSVPGDSWSSCWIPRKARQPSHLMRIVLFCVLFS